MNLRRFSALALIAALAGCTQGSTVAPTSPSAVRDSRNFAGHSKTQSSLIAHVVIIIQENRTTNNLFNFLPGAGVVRTAKTSQGKTVQLQPESLTAPYDIGHNHSNFKLEYANGQLDGFDKAVSYCNQGATCPASNLRAYAYVPESDVYPYYVMAQRFTFASRMFQTSEGPSFPAHQYLLSGTSTTSDGSSVRASENAYTTSNKNTGGCDSPAGSFVKLIDQNGNENTTAYPCFQRDSLIALIEAAGLTWHYYQANLVPGLWNAPDAIESIRESPQFSTDVVAPPSKVLNDINAGNLANVVWITPTDAESDHAGITDGSGPSWVASIVNTIGQSQYWKNTAIFVLWDDWGGWYDPVVPPIYNSYELGFRVPLIVISPYTKQHYISNVQHEFGSILKFTEETFNLGSLDTTDARADDLSDCFDFSQAPIKFQTVPAAHGAQYFLKQRGFTREPDDDL